MSEIPQPGGAGPPGPSPVPDAALKQPCAVCKEPVYRDALRCNECGSYQSGKPCIACGKWRPLAAVRCGECDAFQDWRRHIPGNTVVLALLVSLFSVLGTAIPAMVSVITLPAKTAAVVLNAELDPKISESKTVLIVRAFNSGGSASIVTAAYLDLRDVHAGLSKLDIENPVNAEVPRKSKTDLKLFVPEFTAEAGHNRASVAKLLCTGSAILLLHVKEQTWWSGQFVSRPEPVRVEVPGIDIREFVHDKMNGNDPGDC